MIPRKNSWRNSGRNRGNATLKLYKTSTITLTGLDNEEALNNNINLNGYKLYVGEIELKE